MESELTCFDEVQQNEQNKIMINQSETIVQKTAEIGIQCNMFNLPLRSEDITNLIRSDAELLTWTNIPSYEVLDSIIKCVQLVCEKPKKVNITFEKLIILAFIKIKMNLPFANIAILFRL